MVSAIEGVPATVRELESPPLWCTEGQRGVYVLEINKRGLYTMFYVGKSEDLFNRVHQHLQYTDECAQIVRQYDGSVVSVHEPIVPRVEDLGVWEQKEFLLRVVRHGVGNVRGWIFTQSELQAFEYEVIRRMIVDAMDVCNKCGNHGHFAMQCDMKQPVAPWLGEIEALRHNALTREARLHGDNAKNAMIKQAMSMESAITPVLKQPVFEIQTFGVPETANTSASLCRRGSGHPYRRGTVRTPVGQHVRLVKSHPSGCGYKKDILDAYKGKKIRTPKIGDTGKVISIKHNGALVIEWDAPEVVCKFPKMPYEVKNI